MNVPAAVTVWCLGVNHNESFLIGQCFVIRATIKGIGSSRTPVNPDNDRRLGEQILRNIEPCTNASWIRTKVGDFCVGRTGERRVDGASAGRGRGSFATGT